MANPQLENGFLSIASGDEGNDILKALVRAELSGGEYQIILLVIRQTYGFKKKEDWISLTQFEKITNKSRARVSECIKTLVKKNILVKRSVAGLNAYYGLNKDFDTWNKLVKKSGLVKNTRQTSKEYKTQLVKNTLPTKETLTKENIQKCTFSYKECKTFCAFYEKYPSKKAPMEAHKSWHKVKDKPPLEELLKIIEKHKSTEQWKKGIIPHPSTWLNQGRWDDEIEQVKSKFFST